MSNISRSIAILGGTGPAGTGLGLRWARAGETIIIGSRDAQRAQEAADRGCHRANTFGFPSHRRGRGKPRGVPGSRGKLGARIAGARRGGGGNARGGAYSGT